MSSAISAHGTLISRNAVTIGELRDITPPPLTRNTFETTTQQDSDDSYVVGVRRKGELSFNINFLPSGDASHGNSTGLLAAYSTGSKDLWKITFPDASTMTFSGFLTNLAVSSPVDGEQSAQVTVRPTGGHIFVP